MGQASKRGIFEQRKALAIEREYERLAAIETKRRLHSYILGTTMKELYRHIKTDGVYEVICNALIEDTGVLAVVYKNILTGERWIRLASEFNDGRFRRI